MPDARPPSCAHENDLSLRRRATPDRARLAVLACGPNQMWKAAFPACFLTSSKYPCVNRLRTLRQAPKHKDSATMHGMDTSFPEGNPDGISLLPKRCGLCNAPLAPDAKFCSQCGTRVVAPAAVAVAAPAAPTAPAASAAPAAPHSDGAGLAPTPPAVATAATAAAAVSAVPLFHGHSSRFVQSRTLRRRR